MQGLDLMNRLLTYDPVKRISVRPAYPHETSLACAQPAETTFVQAKEALSHPYFREKPFPQESYMMPTFPSLHPDMKELPANNTQQAKGVYRPQDNARFGRAFDSQSGSAAEKRRRL